MVTQHIRSGCPVKILGYLGSAVSVVKLRNFPFSLGYVILIGWSDL